MYSHIMIPVDLAHVDRLERAVTTGGDIARLYGGDITFVGVTSTAPGTAAHSPEEYRARLDAYATSKGAALGVTARGKTVISHDPAVDMDKLLLQAAEEVGADLVVMATHAPRGIEWSSHGGHLATHASISVLLVRPG